MTQPTSKTQALSGRPRTKILSFSPQGWAYIFALLTSTVMINALYGMIPAIISGFIFLFVVNYFQYFERHIPRGDAIKIQFIQIGELITHRIVSYISMGHKASSAHTMLAHNIPS